MSPQRVLQQLDIERLEIRNRLDDTVGQRHHFHFSYGRVGRSAKISLRQKQELSALEV